MKFFIDDTLVYEISNTQKKIIKHVVFNETFNETIKNKIEFIVNDLLKFCLKDLKGEWITRLKENKVESIPLDDEKLAELIFSQPGYKNRSERETFRPGKDAPLINK